MTDTRAYMQGVPYQLSGGGVVIGATTMTINDFVDAYGNVLTMASFGTKGYGTCQPNALGFEEAITFTGVTDNGDGTYTLTGISSQLAQTPYTEASGFVRSHPGASNFIITNTAGFYDQFASKHNNETIDQIWTFATAATPLITDQPTTNTMAANKLYVDTVAIFGAPLASTTTAGIVEEATQAEVDARTAAGGTTARLYTNPPTLRTVLMHDYIASATGTDAYAITCVPAVTALTTGDLYIFKADVANTGNATLAVNGLTAKNILKGNGATLEDNDIRAGQIVTVVYNGTSMLMQSLLGNEAATRVGLQNGSYVYAATASGNDTYAITVSPVPAAYANGQMFSFKTDVGNTGAATLNVNTLGAISLVRSISTALITGDIVANEVVTVKYNSTGPVFQIIDPPVPLIAGSTSEGSNYHYHSNLLNSSNTDVSLSDTNETTLYSFSLPANTLGTANGVRIRVPMSVYERAGASTQTFKFKYGTTTVATVVLSGADGTGQSGGGTINAELFGAGATNSQFGFLTAGGGGDSGALFSEWGSDDGTAAEDSTGALTLTITAQRSNNTASSDLTSIGGYTERI